MQVGVGTAAFESFGFPGGEGPHPTTTPPPRHLSRPACKRMHPWSPLSPKSVLGFGSGAHWLPLARRHGGAAGAGVAGMNENRIRALFEAFLTLLVLGRAVPGFAPRSARPVSAKPLLSAKSIRAAPVAPPPAVTQSREKDSRPAAQPAPLFLPLFKPGASLRPHSSHHSPFEGESRLPSAIPSRPASSHHSPLEGESQQPSRQAQAAAVGGIRPLRLPWMVGCSRRVSCSPHRRDIGLAPSSCRLPLKGGVVRENCFSSLRLRNGLEPPKRVRHDASLRYVPRSFAVRSPRAAGAARSSRRQICDWFFSASV